VILRVYLIIQGITFDGEFRHCVCPVLCDPMFFDVSKRLLNSCDITLKWQRNIGILCHKNFCIPVEAKITKVSSPVFGVGPTSDSLDTWCYISVCFH